MEWLTLLAIIVGPILAVQAEKIIERLREEKRERKFIFLTLMRTRSNILLREHVDALNMIPLVFSKKNPHDTEARRRWELLLSHRSSVIPTDPTQGREWATRGVTHLTNLLLALAKALHYKFDENDIQRVYAPRAHETELLENQEARQLLLQLLRGQTALKIEENVRSGQTGSINPLGTICGENSK
jgi:hypothetical protein